MKFIKTALKGLAVLGGLVVVGGVGTMDYMTTVGQSYSIWYTVITLVIGVLMMLPAVLYWGFGYGKE